MICLLNRNDVENIEVARPLFGDVVAEKLLGARCDAVAIRLRFASLNGSVRLAGRDDNGVQVSACARDGVFNGHVVWLFGVGERRRA